MEWQNIWTEPLSKPPGQCFSPRTYPTDFGQKPCQQLPTCGIEALPKQSVGWLLIKLEQEKIQKVHSPRIWNEHQTLSIVWSTQEKGISQQRCHFQSAEVWVRGVLSGSERRSHNHLFTLSIQMNPQRLMSHSYLPYDIPSVIGDSPTSVEFGAICLINQE